MVIRTLIFFALLLYPTLAHTQPFFLLSKIENGRIVKVAGSDVNSRKNYWPASTIKLAPAVAVMEWAKKNRVSVNARIRFKDSYGWYRGTLRSILRATLTRSSNKGYDRLVRIAGMDYVNALMKKKGLKHTWVSVAYGGRYTLRRSPRIWVGRRSFRSRWSRKRNRSCRMNCTSLSDLQRLLVLAHSYPTLRRYMRRARPLLKSTLRKRFGRRLRIYNKSGYVGKYQMLANCMFVWKKKKWLLTIVIKSKKRGWGASRKEINRQARKILKRHFPTS